LDYGIEVVNFSPLLLGADIHAKVYKAQSADLTSYFIKLKKGHDHEMGVKIAEFLHHQGIQQIIPPIRTFHDKPTQQLEDCTLIFYPFIEGKDGFKCDLTDVQWIELGKSLRKIHEIDVPLSIQNVLRRESYSPKWREIARSLSVLRKDELMDDTALKLWHFMQTHSIEIQRIVDRSEQLALQLHSQSSEFVLCHSDIHAGNVLLSNNNKMYIVDLDDPIMAPKERDLMFIGGGVGNVWNKPYQEALFYKGYGTTEILSKILTYYRYERIVEDVAVYGQELLLTKEINEGRLEMYKNFIGMFEPQGVVDVAFQTDQKS
jgi:spectinomycin phosphotransferase